MQFFVPLSFCLVFLTLLILLIWVDAIHTNLTNIKSHLCDVFDELNEAQKHISRLHDQLDRIQHDVSKN